MIVVVVGSAWFGGFSQLFGAMLINVAGQTMLSLHFHLRWVLVALLCVLPGMLYEICKRLYWPSDADVFRFRSRIRGCVDLESTAAREYLRDVRFEAPARRNWMLK